MLSGLKIPAMLSTETMEAPLPGSASSKAAHSRAISSTLAKDMLLEVLILIESLVSSRFCREGLKWDKLCLAPE